MQQEQFIHIDRFGNKFYYSDREMKTLHRTDGYAIVDIEGKENQYWFNGVYYTDFSFKTIFQPNPVDLIYNDESPHDRSYCNITMSSTGNITINWNASSQQI